MEQTLVRFFVQQYVAETPADDRPFQIEQEITRDRAQPLSSFVVESGGPLTLCDIMDAFPVQGSFQFRFKCKADPGGYVWLDVNDPDATVPRYGECVWMKARATTVLGKPVEPKYYRVDRAVWEDQVGWNAPNSVGSAPAEPPARPVVPSVVYVDAEAVVEGLRAKIQDRFDQDQPGHVALLKGIFEAVFPGQPLDGMQSVHWLTLGAQEQDPNYFADAHRMIVDNTASTGGYSFLQYGMGLAYVLVQCMGFDLVNGIHLSTLSLLREPDAFEEIFCALFLYGDRRWVEGREKDVDALLRKLHERVEEGLNAEPQSVIAFRDFVTRSKDMASQAKEALGKAKEGIGSALAGFKNLFK